MACILLMAECQDSILFKDGERRIEGPDGITHLVLYNHAPHTPNAPFVRTGSTTFHFGVAADFAPSPPSRTQPHAPAGRGQWPVAWTERMQRAMARWRGSSSSGTAQDTSEESSFVSTAQRSRWPWPSDWRDMPYGSMGLARMRYPCIGAACAARGEWHEAGITCRAYRDTERYIGKYCIWQRMCEECSDSGAILWTPLPASTAATSPRVATPSDLWDNECYDALIDQNILEAVAQYEREKQLRCTPSDEEQPTSPSPPPPPPQPRQPSQPPIPTPMAVESPFSPPPPLTAASEVPPPPMISHDDERLQLGKPLWLDVAQQIPRPQHDGTLLMPRPRQGGPVELQSLEAAFPTAPFIHPEAAETRASAALDRAAGQLSEVVKEEVRACFECEAARMSIARCCPELRYNKTKGPQLKAAAERCTTVARQASREREQCSAVVDESMSIATATEVARLLEAAAPAETGSSNAVDDQEWMGAALVHVDASALHPSKLRKRSWNADYNARVKKSSFSVTLAALRASLELPKFKAPVADARMRCVAKAAGVKQKLGLGYSACDRVTAVVAAMETGNDKIAPCKVLDVIGVEV